MPAASALHRQPRQWLVPMLASPTGAVLLLVGIATAMGQSTLPPAAWLAVGCMLAIVLGWRWPWLRWLAIPLFGFAWASLHGHWALAERLPATLEGADLRVSGRITGLPQPGERRVGFDFVVDAGEGDAAVLAGRRLRLAWYGNSPPELEPGARWQFELRLRRPRGVQNPGGFDYERHALQRRIAATGHVRDSADNRLLAADGGIDGLRARLSEAIGATVERPSARFLQGLAVGDTRALDGRDWDTLRATGLSHLLAISGLHIGLVAGFGALLARGVYWLFPGLGLRLPRPQGMALLALLAAAGYASLAGFGLPTQRSLAMVATVLLAVLSRRSLHPGQALALAALVIALADPLAVLGAGFWLSFLGVMWLLLCLPDSAGLAGKARSLLWAQWTMSLGLLPLTVWFFGQASVAGAFANLLAVPWVTLVVVPATLLGSLVLPWAPGLAAWPLGFAAWAMDGLWEMAERVAAVPGAQLFLPEPALLVLLLALIGVGWLLLPRALPGKAFALLLLAPLALPARDPLAAGEYELWLFDVGQGLSLLLRTPEQSLLYDAGPAFTGGLDLGEAAVVPALRALGVRQLDVLVLSHSDNDHAGGAGAVQRAYPRVALLAGEPSRHAGATPCLSGAGWPDGSVPLVFLHPPAHFPELRNESSCVLRVDGPGGATLLTGDIGQVIEQRLLREQRERLDARILLVPHHGSAGSSSEAFVAAVAPELALIGVGHRNRFGHPREEVLARYRAQDSRLLDTASGGATRLRIAADGRISIERRRDSHRRFWHET
jgi:competence protein ComEC